MYSMRMSGFRQGPPKLGNLEIRQYLERMRPFVAQNEVLSNMAVVVKTCFGTILGLSLHHPF